jgi:hypothetical protein
MPAQAIPPDTLLARYFKQWATDVAQQLLHSEDVYHLDKRTVLYIYWPGSTKQDLIRTLIARFKVYDIEAKQCTSLRADLIARDFYQTGRTSYVLTTESAFVNAFLDPMGQQPTEAPVTIT